MIGFGELRRLALHWQTDLAGVERVYALDWLLAGVFEHDQLRPALALRGEAALGKAYMADYPQPEEADFALLAPFALSALELALREASAWAASRSGLQFRLLSANESEARFEYTGPLGRRSAAQPHLPFRFNLKPLLAPAVDRPLIHPFSDPIATAVRAESLAELAAERLVMLGGRPRARDIYDLWFVLTRGRDQLDHAAVVRLAERMAAEKGRALRPELDPAYRPLIEKAWENALKKLPGHPPFAQVESDIRQNLA